jgi:hypothetical protein
MLAFCLFAIAMAPAAAGDSGTAAVNLLPAKGQHRGIVLKAQTVDTVISESQGQVWADTKVWMKLQNPASKPITVSVTLPGRQMAPLPLPADLTVAVGKAPLQLVSSASADDGKPTGATAAINIPARKGVDVRIAYRQALSDTNGIFIYIYLLNEASQWAGTPESLRLTIDLKPPLSWRSLLTLTPPAHHSEGQSMTWDWENDWGKSGVNVGLAFMSPKWYAEFEAAQSAAAGENAGAAQHILLSKQYGRLASLQGSLLNTPFVFQSRYYPAAIAELQAALDAKGSTTEQAQTHASLASLYVQQAEQADQDSKQKYLQAAAAEILAALAQTPPESNLLELAEKVLGDLSRGASAAGESAAARSYLDQIEDVRAFSPQQVAQRQLASHRLSQATLALEQGSTETARVIVDSMPEAQFAILPGAAAPIVSQTALTVTTNSQQRQIVAYLGRDTNAQEASALATETARALRSQAPVQAVSAGNGITLTLPGPPGPAMFLLQKDLAEALPNAPELALLHSVLADSAGYTGTRTNLLQSTWQYTEVVDFAPAMHQWEEIAARLDRATPNSPRTLPPAESEEVQRIQRAIWASDASAWRRLAANSRVDYRFEPTASDTSYQWQIGTGESRQMVVQMAQWNPDRVHWASAALFAAVAGLAALLWRIL